ncbi:MAG: folate-binding protein YgfZ [Planctomycetes bacterium]|nr:folate-binding protein YgfZ [Planctomycetota bacterium]
MNVPFDYQAALHGVALFDLSNRSKIELAGAEAVTFLHNLCTQDIKTLAVGETREAFLTSAKARVIAHAWITHHSLHVLRLDTVAGQSEKVIEHLNHFLISEQVEVIDRTMEIGMLRLVGPRAAGLAEATSTPARRHRWLNAEACDIFCPMSEAAALRQRLIAAGAILGSPATYHLLRIEAGLPEFGIDIDENRLAMEVNRPQAISYNKGCYLGQETIVMARDRGQVNRLLMGVTFAGMTPLDAGTKLFRGNDEVGQVTSSAFSPRLGRVIALAYLRRGSWDAGTKLVIDPAVSGTEAVVCALPFAAGAVATLP